jgi:hypothetical protein
MTVKIAPPQDPMKTVFVEAYRPSEKEPVWSYRAKNDEYICVKYTEWGVIVDIAPSREDLMSNGNGVTRKIFHGCSVIEDLERDEEKKA